MKIASNKLSDLFLFYKNELSFIYDDGELYAMFETVCEHFLHYSKAQLKQHFTENINQSDVLHIYNTGIKLKEGIPLQYILGKAYFYDSFFKVNSFVLIPRPETEELVDLIINNHQTTITKNDYILDIGTGSGCIPITLKKHLALANIVGIDVCNDALNCAKQNALALKQDVTFIAATILQPLPESLSNQSFSIIVSNPPYVLKTEALQMDSRVLQHEPHLALFVDDTDPIIFYKRIIDLCKTILKPNGFLYFELNPLFASVTKAYAIDSNLFSYIEIINDMSGKDRFLKAIKI